MYILPSKEVENEGIIDCSSQGRAFILNSGQTEADVIRGITIRNGMSLVGDIPNVENETGGGAILIIGTSPQILDCVLEDNIAFRSPSGSIADGGAIDCVNATPIIAGNTIRNNHSTHTGGGIHAYNSHPIIMNNIISENVNDGCYGGGGLSFIYGSGGIVANNLIVGNEARYYSVGGYGGGIICMNADPYIVNNTITGNTTWFAGDPGEGGGVRIRGLPSSVMANNIIWGNESEPGLEDLDFQYPDWVLDIHHCDVGVGLVGLDTGGAIGNISEDPLFENPVIGNYKLQSLSPCFNTGDTPSLPQDSADLDGGGNLVEPVPYDLVGGLRVDAGAVDIGAFERQSLIFADAFESGTTSSW